MNFRHLPRRARHQTRFGQGPVLDGAHDGFERSEAVIFLKHETAIGRKAADLHGPLKYLNEGWPVSPRNSRDIQEAAEQGDAQPV